MSRDGPLDPLDPGGRFRLGPDSGWDDVQRQYRHLVQRWHPDRHPPATRAEAQAEFIEIVTAFKRLRRHYGEHGRLPRPGPPSPTGERPVLPPRPSSPAPDFPAPRRAPDRRTTRLRAVLRSPSTAALAALAIALSLIALVIVLDRQLAEERRDEARAREAVETRPPPR